MKYLVSATVMAALVGACSKKDSADPVATAGTTSSIATSAYTASLTNKLSVAFPASLALSVFPKGSGTSLMLDEAVTAADESSIKEKVQKREKKLDGKSDECLDLASLKEMNHGSTVKCYEFDSDMNPFKTTDVNKGEFGTLDGSDGKGEACMVAFARNETQDSVDTIDTALDLFSGMLCQGKKDGVGEKALAAGESLDLKDSFSGAAGGMLTVTEASMARLADKDGAEVYRSDIAFTGEGGRTFEAHLVHSPSADGEKGTLWFKRGGGTTGSGSGSGSASGSGSGPAVDPNNSANKNHVLSINYEKSTVDGVPHVAFEVRRASIVNTIDPFTAEGLVNYAGVAEEAQNSEINAIKYVAFDGNPDTNEGNLSYWMNPGGSYNESARGFLFNVTADATTGILAGCGVSGATTNVSIRKALGDASATNVLAPTRYYHPQENHNIHPDKDPRFNKNDDFFITEQCFVQDATTKLYSVDTAKTTDDRGYSVIATAVTKVLRPEPPKAKLGEGEFEKPPVK